MRRDDARIREDELEKLNRAADELNAEIEEVLEYQADWASRKMSQAKPKILNQS